MRSKISSHAERLDFEAGLFAHLAAIRFVQRSPVSSDAAGQRPIALQRFFAALHQQDSVAVENERAHAQQRVAADSGGRHLRRLNCTAPFTPSAVDRSSRGDVEGLKSASPKAQLEGVSASRIVCSSLPSGAYITSPWRPRTDRLFHPRADAAGNAGDSGMRTRSFESVAVAVHIVSADVALVGIGDVENTSVGRKRDAVGPGRELARPASVRLWAGCDRRRKNPARDGPALAESRIGEIDVAALADHDIVGSIQPLAFPLSASTSILPPF